MMIAVVDRGFAVLVFLFCLAGAQASVAHERHDHGEVMPPEKLGTVHFLIVAGPEVQRDFDRAVALLHSFQYEDAEKAFAGIAAADPTLGMAYWGIAMCNYHPLWGPTTQADFERGRAAAERAARLGATTERELEYIRAIGTYYAHADRLDFPSRKIAYEGAMQRLHARYPDDMEGTILYALALLGAAPATDKTYAKQRQAADLLNAILPKAPDHPGVAHYLIHSLDYPSLASLALPAARAYARIAPSSPHAQHMPSHIFTRLGFWDESIRSNLASEEAARRLMARTHPGATHFDGLHAMDYLEYAYLQLGDLASARTVMERMRAVSKVDHPAFSAAYAFAAVPARYALERHQWGEAAALPVSPDWFPWKDFPWAEAVTHFARGVGAARSGDLTAAGGELQRLARIRDALVGVKASYNWADQVEVQRRAVRAWMARSEGKDDEAVTLLRSAADLEDSIDKHPVTPGAVLPAREQLADLLLELGKPDDAVKEYETVLKSCPGRRNSLRGLQAAKHPPQAITSSPGLRTTPPSRSKGKVSEILSEISRECGPTGP
jgi:tetratricopeptide (TPR) repeat protein